MGTSIPMMGQQAPITSPIQNVSQILNAKDLASQISLRQSQAAAQQAQTANVQAEAQQRQRDQNDQQVVQQAMQDPAQNIKFHQGDFSGVAGRVQPKTLALMQQEQAKLNESLLANTSAKNKERAEALSQINDTLNGLSTLTGADGKPDLNRINQALPSAVNNLAKAGLFDQAGIDQSSVPGSITDIKQIGNAQAALGGAMAAHQQVLAQQKTQAETAEAAGKGAQAQSEADIKTKQLAGMTPTGLLPEEQVKNQQAAATLAQTQARMAQEARHEGNEDATARGNLSLRQQEFTQNYGAPGDANTVSGLAQALIDGKISTADVRRMKGGQAAIQQAVTKDPTWTEQRYQGMKNFETGKDAEQLSQFNMLAGHLDAFKTASANEGLRINPFSGSAAQLSTVGNDVAGIMGRLVKGGALTQSEHQDYMKRLNSPLQSVRDSAADEMKSLVNEKLSGMQQKYKNATGMDMPAKFLTPKAQAMSGGSVIDTKEKYDALPSGSVYTESDGKKYRKP